MRVFSHRKRPPHLGPYPLELLPRQTDAPAPGSLPPRPTEGAAEGPFGCGHAYATYVELFDSLRNGDVAPERAPIPDDPAEIAANLKAGIYFLDADMAGTCVLPGPEYAVVVLIAFKPDVAPGEPGADWIRGTQQQNAELRAGEIAVITAGYIRNLGFAATAHTATASDIDLNATAVQAGLAEVSRGRLRNPYLPGGFGLAAVTTDLPVAPDGALARRRPADLVRTHGPRWWFGLDGTKPGWRRLAGERRPMHMGRYPMERIRRVDQPTTRISDDVPRVPKRASFFIRAEFGDFGERFRQERKVFAYKTPQAQAYVRMIRGMVPHQDGPVADEPAPGTADPDANANAVKALAYYLGGDMVGVCRVPTYAWYSHETGGERIDPYHRNAVVILLDQGYETMEGASGDDWVSGAQSMRAYMRGAEIAGVLAEHLRRLGWSARSQTNADSHVLHIPLVLHAGLGELSRIGELVLNPFVGPRFKSVVVTTDMPLTPDRHVDFGLQDFCSSCMKCARECPPGAISFGDKVMFNGYEMWKPDVEKCTKYRLGNLKGSACGRCMKTCPFNTEGLLSHRLWLWAAIKLPFMRQRIAIWDDKVGNGSINPIKKWWWDLEWRDGRTIEPAKGTNARELDFDRTRLAKTQKVALYPADVNPAPDAATPVTLDRKAAVVTGQRAKFPG